METALTQYIPHDSLSTRPLNLPAMSLTAYLVGGARPIVIWFQLLARPSSQRMTDPASIDLPPA